MKSLRELGPLAKRTFSEWNKHDASTLGASLSYYTVLSMAPLLVIAISIAGIFFGRKAAQGEIVNQVTGLVGPSGAQAIEGMLAHAKSPAAGIVATLIGFVVLLIGASGVFTQLRKALNRIWEVEPKETSGLWDMLREEFFSFAMVVGIGFLLLVSLVVSAVLTGMQKFASGYLPAGILEVVNFLVSLAVITGLFAAIYRVVPERRLPWRTLWVGSLATGILCTIGKVLIGLYLGRASVASAYGAAGSLVVLLMWVYYSSQLFLFGAEFTRLYAKESGALDGPANKRNNKPAPPQARAVDGRLVDEPRAFRHNLPRDSTRPPRPVRQPHI
jgi:membrane protein